MHLPCLDCLAVSLPENCHSQLLIQDALILPHNYNTDYISLSKLNMGNQIAKLVRLWEPGCERLPVPFSGLSGDRGVAHKGLWNQVAFLYLSPALSAQRPLACGSCEALHLAFTEGRLHPGSFPFKGLFHRPSHLICPTLPAQGLCQMYKFKQQNEFSGRCNVHRTLMCYQ